MFCKGFLELRERKDEGVSLCQDELITCVWKDCPPWWLLEDSMLSVPFPAMQDIWILCVTPSAGASCGCLQPLAVRCLLRKLLKML